MRTAFVNALVLVCGLTVPTHAAAPPVHDCDRLAVHPDDPNRVTDGVASEDIDIERAVAACEAAVASFPGAIRFRAQLGRALLAGERIQEAIAQFRFAVETGNAIGEFELAKLYASGRGVEKDTNQAIHWFRQAAMRGLPQAQYQLGVIYHLGVGVAPDLQKAIEWLRRAVDAGHEQAIDALASAYSVMLVAGSSSLAPTWMNAEEALIWLRQYAESSHAISQYHLGTACELGYSIDINID